MEFNLSRDDILDILLLINDGFLFEKFAQELLTARLGYTFVSSGGIKDRGIDGLEYTSEIVNTKNVVQLSINKNVTDKIKKPNCVINNTYFGNI